MLAGIAYKSISAVLTRLRVAGQVERWRWPRYGAIGVDGQRHIAISPRKEVRPSKRRRPSQYDTALGLDAFPDWSPYGQPSRCAPLAASPCQGRPDTNAIFGCASRRQQPAISPRFLRPSASQACAHSQAVVGLPRFSRGDAHIK